MLYWVGRRRPFEITYKDTFTLSLSWPIRSSYLFGFAVDFVRHPFLWCLIVLGFIPSLLSVLGPVPLSRYWEGPFGFIPSFPHHWPHPVPLPPRTLGEEKVYGLLIRWVLICGYFTLYVCYNPHWVLGPRGGVNRGHKGKWNVTFEERKDEWDWIGT